MRIQIKLFGPQAQLAGTELVSLQLPDGATCAELWRPLQEAAPALRDSLPASRLAVNHAYADDAQTLTENDEVALIGLVSGG